MSRDCFRSPDGRYELRGIQKEYGGPDRGIHNRWQLVEASSQKVLGDFSGDVFWKKAKDGAVTEERSGVQMVSFSPDGRAVLVRSYDAPERRIDLLALEDPSRTGEALGEQG